jgi:hypothetical protein
MVKIQRSYEGGPQRREVLWGDLIQIIRDLYAGIGGNKSNGELDPGWVDEGIAFGSHLCPEGLSSEKLCRRR